MASAARDEAYAEPRDDRFWSLIERDDLSATFASWWPTRGGPSWDAVARSGDGAVVLIEAKAHPTEFEGPGLAATSARSIGLIETALNSCREDLSASGPLTAWTAAHYQLANRLAWTLRLRDEGQLAYFAYVCFAGDRSNVSASPSALGVAAMGAFEALGVQHALTPDWAATLFLAAVD